MRLTLARILLGVTAAVAGLALMLPAGAAESSDDEFKALVEQDVKAITKATDAVGKSKAKATELNAKNAIKSSAVVMATYANARAGSDGKAAAVRDQAIKIFQAADKKDFKAVESLAKELGTLKAGDAKQIDVAKALGELTSKDVMDNFKTTDKFGTNGEADIKANGKKATIKAADANLIAHRVLTMGELNKTVTKAENAADKKEWEGYNEKMLKSAADLQAASKKKTAPAELAKIFTSLDASCTACHDKFK